MGASNAGDRTEYTHHTAIDGSNTYGKCNGFPRRPMVGGCWSASTACGSRAFAIHVNTALRDYRNS